MDKGAPVVGSMDAYAQSFESVTNKFLHPQKKHFRVHLIRSSPVIIAS